MSLQTPRLLFVMLDIMGAVNLIDSYNYWLVALSVLIAMVDINILTRYTAAVE
jgi:hypothetical protein